MATLIFCVISVYLSVGLLAALLLCVAGNQGLARLDPAARGASLFVRLLLIPGLSALWPLFVFRWFRASSAEVGP